MKMIFRQCNLAIICKVYKYDLPNATWVSNEIIYVYLDKINSFRTG